MHKINKIHATKTLKTVLYWLAFLGLLLFTLKVAHAQGYLGDGWDQYIKGVDGFTPNNRTGEELAINLVLNGIRIVRNVIGAVALIMGVIYGVKMIIARGQEDELTKQRNNFLWLFMGFMVLIVAENIAAIFNPERATTEALIDFDATRDQLRDVVSYIKWLLGSIAVLFGAISSVKMVVAGGQEEEISKQKKNITWSFMGMLVVLLASNIVNAIYVIRSPAETAAGGPASSINELTSIIRLILVFMGPIAIAFTIYAGFMYLTALDDEEKVNKSKRMITAGVVGIIIIYAAFAIVNTFTSADLTAFNPYLV